jgi:hypothetical protein
MTISTDTYSAHFDGDKLRIDPKEPFKLTVVIDNEDRAEWPENPFTLNAFLGDDRTNEDNSLMFGGEGCIIEGDIPAQLRALADDIESGRIFR